ncbi:PilZ domain-containing protein [Erythrobacter sp.]|uniref:PilZ domain-containing protein n=1 Tax=Erythrobacter sp. TaxID=1042 RepID=UPI0025FE76B5|nr:PilZ domain-containing protein [Erythrobacter sp.]
MTVFGRRRSALAPREKRRAERAKANAPAFVETPASRDTVTVVDFSATGARVIGSSPPPSRQDVWLNVNGLALFGTIVWRKDNSFGVRFEPSMNECDPSELSEAIQKAEFYAGAFDREAVLQGILMNVVNTSSDEEAADER